MFLRTLTPKRNAPFILMDESQGLSGAESGKYPAHCRLWFQAEGNFFSFLAGLSLDHAFLWYRVCHFASTLEDVKTRGDQAQGFEGCWRIQDEEIGGLSLFNAVAVLDAEDPGGIGGNQVEDIVDLIVPTHVTEEES